MTAGLNNHPTHEITWTVEDAESGIAAWMEFLQQQDVAFELPEDVPRLVATMQKRATASTQGRDAIVQRLAWITNGELEQAGRGERMWQLATAPGATPQWMLLGDDDKAALQASGSVRFAVTPGKRLLLSLATLPLAIGIYALGYYGYTRERWDWVGAAVVLYVLWLLLRRWVKKKTT